jgi:hypothetical protein
MYVVPGKMERFGGGSCFQRHFLGSFNVDWARGFDVKGRRSFAITTVGREVLPAVEPLAAFYAPTNSTSSNRLHLP